MEEEIRAYPLCWPGGRLRTRYPERSRFKTSANRAMDHMLEEIERLGGSRVVVSTNVELRQDGLPYANRRQPSDMGVAVYFQLDGAAVCMSCDRWDRIGDNVHAIGLTIEALRSIARHGSGDMVNLAFTGFRALPEPPKARAWHEVLGVSSWASEAEIRHAHRALAKQWHPDVNATPQAHGKMVEINAARDAGLAGKR